MSIYGVFDIIWNILISEKCFNVLEIISRNAYNPSYICHFIMLFHS